MPVLTDDRYILVTLEDIQLVIKLQHDGNIGIYCQDCDVEIQEVDWNQVEEIIQEEE